MVTPNNNRPARHARLKHLSSEVATINFAESDSETETVGKRKMATYNIEMGVVGLVGRVQVEGVQFFFTLPMFLNITLKRECILLHC